MAKTFILAAGRVHDLTTVIESLKPADIAKHAGDDTMKNINRVSKLIDELAAADGPYAELSKQVDAAAESVRKDFQEKLKSIGDDEGAKSVLVAEANESARKAITAKSEEIGYKEAGEKAVTVTVGSDERFDLLKKLVEKIGPEMYLQTRPLSDTWTALEEAKEV